MIHIWTVEPDPVHPHEVADPAALSVRELLTELSHLQDRINHDAAAGSYQHLPGQTRRRAALQRREQTIITELRQRRSETSPLHQVFPAHSQPPRSGPPD